VRKNLITATVLAVFLLYILPFSAYGGEPRCPELSLDQAISYVLIHNKTLKRSGLDVDYADELREDASSAWHPKWYTTYEPGIEALYAALLSADYGYKAAGKGQELQEDLVVAETQKRYYDIIQAIEKVSVKQITLVAAEKDFNVSKAYFEVGMLSRIGFDQASMQVAQKRSELKSAENELSNVYIVFNQLIGLNPEDLPVLTFLPEFKELEVENLSSEISSIVSKNPAQLIAEEGADLKMRLIGFSSNYDKAEIEAEQSEIDAVKLREDTKKALYNMYYNIKNMENSYQVSQESIMLARESLRFAELKYKLGMATSADVIAAEAVLAEAKQGSFTLTCQHELLKLAFKKPWTAAVILGTTR